MTTPPPEGALVDASPEASERARALFRDEPAWLVRAARLVATGEAIVPAAILEVAREEAALLERVAPPAARAALEEVLLARDVQAGLQWLQQSGVVARLLPELEATVEFSQEAGRRHKDVWEHTKLVVRQSVPRPPVRWAALLHDIGKVPTRTFTGDGKVHFHGHSEVGARMFDAVSRRFAFDKPTRQKIRFLILHHLRANQYEEGWTDSAVRRFDREMGEHLEDLLDLSRADVTSRRPGRRQEALRQISDLSARIRALRAEDARLPLLPTGLGADLMACFGLPPSKRIGDVKKALEAAIEAGELEPRREPAYYLDHVRAKGLLDA